MSDLKKYINKVKHSVEEGTIDFMSEKLSFKPWIGFFFESKLLVFGQVISPL